MAEPRKVSIRDWLETAPPAIRGCITDDKVFLDNNKCTTDVFCPYRLANNGCKKHTQKPTGDTHVVLASDLRQVVSIDDCANNGQQLFLGGICLDVKGSCKFKTAITFNVGVKDSRIDPNLRYAKCLKYYPTVKCAAGSKMMFYQGVCLATGFLECNHQWKEIVTDPVDEEGGRRLAYCTKFNRFE